MPIRKALQVTILLYFPASRFSRVSCQAHYCISAMYKRRSRVHSQNTRATAQEMTSVIIGMVPDNATMRNAQKNPITHRQDTVDFAAGERSMQEVDLDTLLAPRQITQHFRQ